MPKKEGIRRLFDDIAPRYDLFNHLSSFGADRRWRRTAVKEIVDERRPLDVLDVATGTADFAIAICRKAQQGSHIVGIDLSEGMLEVGRKKCSCLPIELLQADCEALPFDEGRFDRVSVAFGVRNFEHLDKGLVEMCRVLRPGGKMTILELSYPRNAFLRWGFRFYAFHILPRLGRMLSGNSDAYHYLPASIMRFPLPEEFIPIIKAAGFQKVTVRGMTLGTCRMYTAWK